MRLQAENDQERLQNRITEVNSEYTSQQRKWSGMKDQLAIAEGKVEQEKKKVVALEK